MNVYKPKILISKCIEFDNCRYNGQRISSDFVKKLKKFVDFVPICPEVEIELGVPRTPIRIVEKNDKLALIQPETKKDVTKKMIDFSTKFLSKLSIDGAILKSKSPSCGIRNVKVYPTEGKSSPLRKDKGFFGNEVITKFPLYPIEDEDRLRNHLIKEHFLKRIFLFSAFRHTKNKRSIDNLTAFHKQNKFLIMSSSQKTLQKLENIVSNKENKSIDKILEDYEHHLHLAFSQSPQCDSDIHVLEYALGYISENLKPEEKHLFQKYLNEFKEGQVGLSVPISILKSWIIRFDEPYLKEQTYFSPYPEELIELEDIDYCAARDFWK